ncbi:unnamed protein product, partial [Staurois parvus]
NDIFLKFQICRQFRRPYVPTSQGPEHRRRRPASAGGDGRGRCRGHIARVKDKVSAAGTPRATPHGKPKSSLGGLPLLVLKFYPELHSGIPLRRLTHLFGVDLLKLESSKSGFGSA